MSSDLIVYYFMLFRAYQSFNMELEQQIQEFMDREKLTAKVKRKLAIELKGR